MSIVNDGRRRRTDGRRLDGYTIGSPCEPNGSGELKTKSMQRPGTEAIRTQIHPSKPKREITQITNSQNIMRTHGQPREQLFPKSWPLSNPKTAITLTPPTVGRPSTDISADLSADKMPDFSSFFIGRQK